MEVQIVDMYFVRVHYQLSTRRLSQAHYVETIGERKKLNIAVINTVKYLQIFNDFQKQCNNLTKQFIAKYVVINK